MASAQTNFFGSTAIATAVTLATLTLTGNITGVTTLEATTLSGATLNSLSGAVFGDADGGGCSQLTVLNGVGTFETITCVTD